MELLTDKAKLDFEAWFVTFDIDTEGYNMSYYFNNCLPKIAQLAFLIEWFDSVGLYIEVLKFEQGFGFQIWSKTNKKLESIGGWNTRTEATKAAIEKANELYNLKNVK